MRWWWSLSTNIDQCPRLANTEEVVVVAHLPPMTITCVNTRTHRHWPTPRHCHRHQSSTHTQSRNQLIIGWLLFANWCAVAVGTIGTLDDNRSEAIITSMIFAKRARALLRLQPSSVCVCVLRMCAIWLTCVCVTFIITVHKLKSRISIKPVNNRTTESEPSCVFVRLPGEFDP